MAHKHEYCCEHKNVKYCKVCQVVYCVDCGKEWSEKSWHYLYYPYTEPWKITWGSEADKTDYAETTEFHTH